MKLVSAFGEENLRKESFKNENKNRPTFTNIPMKCIRENLS